jgi:iron complex transport system ATP-binding protein
MKMLIYDVHDLKFSYSGKRRMVLDGINLTLEEGEILSILGPNGAGKSTLLDCMATLIKPLSGTIKLCGRNIAEISTREVAQYVSYVPQIHTPAFNYTVLNFVIMGRAPRVGLFHKPKAEDEEAAFRSLEVLGITHMAQTPYTEISGGERQQVMIARAISQQPRVILFDEPTAHLDYGNQYKILQLIRHMSNQGYSIIISTHNPDHALMLGGKAVIIDREGHSESGPSHEIITEERLKRLYNTQVKLLYIPDIHRLACMVPGLGTEVDGNDMQLL